jgi:CDP-diacylglycerol--serine O-phosphatidyltransferase
VLRLARFNSSLDELSVDGKVAFFEGTPIPSTVFITLVLVIGLYHGHSQGPHTLSTVLGIEYHPIVILYAISGVLQASKTIRITKL